ncbi:MAG: LysR family transcriptional regulator [Gammaproteobacteria bacterium]|nr:LysR family transcriptional regulator [Gammaproteobacteria bacterium]
MSIQRLREQLSPQMVAVFFDLCQTRNLSLTARRLGKSKSQVSTLLRNLESTTELSLINRESKQVHVNEQGLSLGKSFYALVNLVHFAEQVNKAYSCNKKIPNISYIKVKIPIRFFGGGMSQALIRSVAICRRLQPKVFIYCEFFDSYNYYHYDQTFWSPDWQSLGELSINYQTKQHSHSHNYCSDWCVLHDNHRQKIDIESLEKLSNYQLIIPKMPWEIMQQMVDFLDKHHIQFIYHHIDYTQLLAEKLEKNQLLLINRLLLTSELCRGHQVSSFPSDLNISLHIKQQGKHQVLSLFQSIFERILQKPSHYFPRFHSRHSWRQWEYLYQVITTGSFVNAAKKCFISQPAISKQIHQMETSIGYTLIHRQAGKEPLKPTHIGKLYLDIAQGIHVASDDLVRQIATQNSYQRQDLNLGILPSIDEKSYLLDLINKITHWQKQFPELRINILEERHHHLLSLLHNQEINLAITEADVPSSLMQYPISSPEPLGLVIHPHYFHQTVIPQELGWQEITDYPLILLRNGTGIRADIEQQCARLGIQLNVALESDSLNLNQQWIKNGKYATILPYSAMRSSIEVGHLHFIPLIPVVSRVLKISHLSARRLNPFEKSLLALLIKES